MFIPEEKHDGRLVVQFVHLVEVVYVVGEAVIAFVKDGKLGALLSCFCCEVSVVLQAKRRRENALAKA